MDATPSFDEFSALLADDEDRAVHRWREEQFRQLGFSPPQALELAVSVADLGQARHLVGSGCEPALAFRILG
jgi:hypothetical protein